MSKAAESSGRPERRRMTLGTSQADLKSGFRKKRFQTILKLINDIVADKGRCRILDIGGRYSYWEDFKEELDGFPIEVTITNLERERGRTSIDDPRFLFDVADARNCPQYADFSFDLVHSNSVIEHVGLWRDMLAMANEVRRVAPAYFVQTPYFWFPIEPHYRTPIINWLPEPWRARLLMKRQLGFYRKAETMDQAMASVDDARLLDLRQFRSLFPDAEILQERVFGLTKSMMAVRRQA
jgi:hypothetical protein